MFAMVFVSVLIAAELDPINRVDCEKGHRHHGGSLQTGRAESVESQDQD